MKILNPGLDLDCFFHRVATAPRRVLFLDYDGTLAPFQIDRRKAIPYPGVRKTLRKIIRDHRTRLVLVSGRSIEDLKSLARLDPETEIWGCHGRERLLPKQGYQASEISESAAGGLARAKAWVEGEGLESWCEEKIVGLVLHLRGQPSRQARRVRRKASAAWGRIAQEDDVTLQKFDGGLELRVPGWNKGDTVRTVLSEVGLNSVSAYLGDDLTDEDAFQAIDGRGLAVLVREKIRTTSAHLWIQPPEEMLAFLQKWISDERKGTS